MSDLFHRTLQDLIKGVRTHKKELSTFISQAIAEIKTELKSMDPTLKAEAVSMYSNMLLYEEFI
jgi:AP-3 complex subunit delta-1